MAISRHKSEASLLIYQKVSKEEKLQMGMSLGHAILNIPKPVLILPTQLEREVTVTSKRSSDM